MCYGYDGHAALDESLARRGSTRRGFLRGAAASLAGAAVVGAVGTAPASAVARHNNGNRVPAGKISIQLYTLRSIMSGAGIESTLAALAHDGYPRVELAGLYGRTAADFRKTLDGFGIRASSSHDGITGSTEALHTKFQNAVTLGQRYVNVPFLASDKLEDWQGWADQMNAEAAVARQYGLRYGYHNHAHEFTTDLGGGVTPW